MTNSQIIISEDYAKTLIGRVRSRSEKSASIIELAIKRFFDGSENRNRFRGKYGFVPHNIAISPTFWCNLSCLDCYPDSSEAESRMLSYEIIDRIVEEATTKWNVPFFTITGGEPISHAIAIAERHPNLLFQVYTNGTLINEKLVGRMEDLGNIVPLISIGGFRDKTDGIRGEGVYDKIMQVMDLLTEKGVAWGISFTLTSQNADVYDDGRFLDMLIDKGSLFGRFLTYVPTGRNADSKRIPSLEQRKRQGDALRNIDSKFLTVDYLNNPGLLRGCAAGGLRFVHIDPSGDVYPCVFIPFPAKFNVINAYRGDYLKEGVEIVNLEDILTKDPLLKMTREMALKRADDGCCLVLDKPEELKTAVKMLNLNY